MSILEHHFPPLIAEKYGVNAAIFLRDIYHWCSTNRDNEQNFHDGRWWTYQTIKALCCRHPYWTKNQVEHIIKTCQEKGALLSGHFSENPLDRTLWYSLTDEAWTLFDGSPYISEISEMQSGKNASTIRKNQKCNKDKHRTENITIPPLPPTGGKGVKAKRDKSVPKWKPERFEAFWNFYRTHVRGEDRQGAVSEWDRLKPDDALIAVMGKALQAQLRSDDWQRGIGIPYAKRWLKHKRWMDSPKAPPEETPPGSGGKSWEERWESEFGWH